MVVRAIMSFLLLQFLTRGALTLLGGGGGLCIGVTVAIRPSLSARELSFIGRCSVAELFIVAIL